MNPIRLYLVLLFTGPLLAATLLSPPADAQETTGKPDLKGAVRDSTGNPVSYASVNLRRASDHAILAYTTTDAGGRYILHIPAGAQHPTTPPANQQPSTAPQSGTPPANQQPSTAPQSTPTPNLYVEVRSIGYTTQTKPVTGLPAAIDFTLGVSASQLQSVIVRNNRPRLHTSGDTLSYKVSDFSSTQDRVIGDVIKRLPGISVAADGTISYNNKPVSGVYLGGDNLLDDRYSIATNTIPQTAVDQVQVIDNHQPVRVLQHKVTSDDVAINLTFKKEAKTQVLGQETIGAGLPGNYYEDLNALFVKDRYKAINYLKANNTGADLQQELLAHNLSDYKQRVGNDPPATMLALGSVNNPPLSRDRYFFNQAGLLNANNLFRLPNGLQLRVNASYLHDRQKQDYSQNTIVYLPADTVRYTETQHNRFGPDLLHAQFTLEDNQPKHYLNDALAIDDNRWLDQSDLNTNGSIVHQALSDRPFSFSNEFHWIAPLRSGRLVQLYSYIGRTSEPETRSIGPDYDSRLFNHDAPYEQLVQQVDVPGWYTNNSIALSIPGNIGTKTLTAGGSFQSQTLVSDLSVLQANHSLDPAADSSVNHVAWGKKKFYAQAAYDIPGENLKAKLTLPLIYQRIGYSDGGYALAKEMAGFYFDPQATIKFKTGIEDFVTLLYRYRNQTGTIEDIYPGYILKDYRTLYANKGDLTLRQDQTAAVGFSRRRALTLFFYSISLAYDHLHANNLASAVITKDFQQLVVLPYPNNTDSWTADGTISKYVFPLRTTFSGDVKWQDNRSVQWQNGSVLPFSTKVATLALGVTTKLSDRLNISYQLTGSRTEAHSSAETPTDAIDQLQQQGAIYYNPTADWQFKLSGEHYFTRSPRNPDLDYFFADALAKYRLKKWKLDLQLEAVNFLDVTAYKAFYLSANTFTAGAYTLPGRIVLLKAMFSL